MKKIISTIVSSLAMAASAFAVEQAQIDAANAITKNGNIEITDDAANVFRPLVELAQSDLSAYVELAKTQSNNLGRWNFCVGMSAKKLGITLNDSAKDFLTGGGLNHAKAIESKSYYEALKARGFTSLSGYKMAEYRIEMLTLGTYADPEAAIRFVRENTLANSFGKLLAAVRRARLGAEAKYNLLSEIATNFEQYKETVKAVKDNWESLQNDKNEAFMAYYAEKKLESLNK